MNKIVIIGHQDSGHIRVEDLLHRCGMKKANLSRRDQLSACEITRSICRAMRAPEVHDPYGCTDFHQIRPSTVWDGLVLDLMLGNLDQDLWGWADSQALLMMDYLAEVDDNLTFVLVYDSPGSVLLKRPEEPAGASDHHLYDQLLDHWAAYNSELLRFFLRHRTRSILVHVDGVTHAVEKTLSMLQARLSAPLQAPEAAMPGERFPDESLLQQSMRVLDTDQMLGGALVESGHATDDAVRGFLAQDAESFLIGSYLNGHPASRQLYEELQGASNLPFEIGKNPRPSPESAWKAFLNQRWFIGQLLAKIHGKNSQLENENRRLSDDQKRYEAELVSTRDHLSGRENRISAMEQELQTQTAALQASRNAVEERDGKLAALGQELLARDAALEESGRLATERDAKIANLEQELQTQTAALQASLNAVEESDSKLAALGQELLARDAALEESGRLATERDAKIANLEQELQTQTAALQASLNAVEERDGKLAALGQELLARDAALEDAGKLATERDTRIADLEQELGTQAAALETALNAVQDRDGRLATLGQELQATNTALEDAGKLATERDARIADLEQESQKQTTALQIASAALKDRDLVSAQLVEQLLKSTTEAERLTQDIVFLKKRLASDTSNLQSLDKERKRLVESNQILEEQISQARVLLEAEVLKLTKNDNEIQHLGSQLEDQNTIIAQLLDQVLQSTQQAKEADALHAENLRKERDENNLLIERLLDAQVQIECLFHENQALLQPSRTPPAVTGAVDRVKNHLSYRIGSLIIQNSKTPRGLINLPFALIAERKRFLDQQSRRTEPKPPPLCEYADIHLAESVKNQLSYRLGHTVVAGFRTPLRCLTLPLAIPLCIAAFHKQKRSKNHSQ